MKFAVIEANQKQIKVSEGDVIELPHLKGKPKDKLVFDKVLLLVDQDKVTIGEPFIAKAQVTGELVEHKKAKKIRVARFKAKSKYRKVKGHRSHLTVVKIKKI